MPLETDPKRSPEHYPQLIEDPVHRFGPYHPRENLMILITLSRFAIGELVELQRPLQHCLSWVSLPGQQPFAAVSKQ